MRLHALRAVLAALGLVGLWMAALVVTRPAMIPTLPDPAPVSRTVPGAGRGPAVADGLLRRAGDRPAFRIDRRPASAAYDPEQGGAPAAVLEGAPGTEGSVVLRRGDTLAGLRVVEMTGEQVVIRGRDTTWRLRVREPWP